MSHLVEAPSAVLGAAEPATAPHFERIAASPWLRRPTAMIWLFLGLIACAELVVSVFSIWLGLIFHCLILVGLPVAAVLARGKPQSSLLICLVVAPLIRIMSLILPLIGFPIADWYLLVSIPVFICCFMLARELRYSWGDLGIVWRAWRIQVAIMLVGFLIGWGESKVLQVHGLAPTWTLAAMLPPSLILFVCTGFMEELIFRGLLRRAAYGLFFDDGVLYISLLFAVLHTGYRSLGDVVFVFVVGLLFAVVARRTGSILGTTASHGIANINLYVLIPLFTTQT